VYVCMCMCVHVCACVCMCVHVCACVCIRKGDDVLDEFAIDEVVPLETGIHTHI
jgi:hypothetical protein